MESLHISRLKPTAKKNEAKSENVVNAERNRSTYTDDYFERVYRKDIWKHLLAQDAKKRILTLHSPQLEFRGTLVRHMRYVKKQLGLSIATLHSAAALLDLFMDSHLLRSDRLDHVAMACLSLAAKNDENYSLAPSLKTLSKTSGVQISGKTFYALEYQIGSYVRWRLLSPTPVTFATFLAKHVVSDSDLTCHYPKFVKKIRKDGAKLLEAYLDLILSDVRLKVLESVDLGCACVACARADLNLTAWPAWLAAIAGRKLSSVAPAVRLLQKMMQKLKSSQLESEGDQGYSSRVTTPVPIPVNSPSFQASAALSTSRPSTSNDLSVYNSYRQPAVEREDSTDFMADLTPQPTRDNTPSPISVIRRPNMSSSERTGITLTSDNCSRDSNSLPTVAFEGSYRLPTAADVACHRVDNPADYRYCMSSKLLEASLESLQPFTNVAVKRGLDANLGLDRKRYRIGHFSQTVL